MVNIVNEFDYKFSEEEIKEYIKFLNTKLGNDKLFSLVFVDIDTITNLNNEFRSLNKETDVLSFEAFEDDYLGDVIICVEVMQRNAIEYGHSEKRELYFLITHGFLHLNGYDHMTKEEELEMFSLQKSLLDEYKVVR